MESKLRIGQNNIMMKEKLGEEQIKPQTNPLPPHVLKIAEESIKQYENGEAISFEEFKERHFSKK
jgi:hypothetical protein